MESKLKTVVDEPDDNKFQDMSSNALIDESVKSEPCSMLPSPGVTELNKGTENLTLGLEKDNIELDPKELAKIEKQNKLKAERETARQERELNKEKERLIKNRQREEEKAERERKKEEEKLERERKKEEEKLERERKKEEERLKKLEQKKLEALEREQKKQAEKERKEQERLLKKKAQEDERLQKREEKKRKLEEEIKKKEDEKRRKEDHSQMRISSFFAVTAESSQSSKAEAIKPSTIQSPTTKPSTTKPSTKSSTKSEIKTGTYEMDFLPFFQKRNVIMASSGQLNDDELKARKSEISALLDPNNAPNDILATTVNFTKPSRNYTTSQCLVEALNSPDLTENAIVGLVLNLPPIKYLQFYENSKPPFVGTWCSEDHLKIRLGPCEALDTNQTGYDYEYDSDLDWQDEGEGEDIDDLEDAEDAEEEDGDDDMDDFVDNTEFRKRGIVGPLQSVSIWNDGSESNRALFEGLKFERLDLNVSFPIDPQFNYWDTKPAIKQELAVEVDAACGAKNTTTTTTITPITPATANILTPQKPTIKDPKVLKELIKFIEENSDFTISTLTELAKKEFKNYTKSILKYTIQSVAIYNKKDSGWKIKSNLDIGTQ